MNTEKKQDLRTRFHIDRLRDFFPEYYCFDTNNIFKICPFTFDELKANTRKKEIVQWRQILIAFKYASGTTFQEAGRFVGNKDHSTCVHALKQVINALEGFDQSMKLKIDEIIAGSETFFYASEDNAKNEVNALRLLEQNFALKYFK